MCWQKCHRSHGHRRACFPLFLGGGSNLLPCRLLDLYVMVAENHPRPKPTTIHFSCGPGSNSCIVTLVCTPVCLTGVPFVCISVGRSAVRFSAAPDNSFSLLTFAWLNLNALCKITIWGKTSLVAHIFVWLLSICLAVINSAMVIPHNLVAQFWLLYIAWIFLC